MRNTSIIKISVISVLCMQLLGCTYAGFYKYCKGEMAEIYCRKDTPKERREHLWQKVMNDEPVSGYVKSWGVGYKKDRIIEVDGPPLRVIPADNERYDEILDYGDWKMLMKNDRLVEVIEPNLDDPIPRAFSYTVYQVK